MRSDLDIWKFAEQALSRREPLILLVVTESSGSSPGRPGFKMAVTADNMCGSIGGGVMEVSLVERARDLIASDLPAAPGAVRQVHRKESEDSSGMICSGEQTVILRRVSISDIQAVRDCIKSIEKESDDAVWITPEVLDVKPSDGFAGVRFEKVADREYQYAESLRARNELIIIGGGHCALALSRVMSQLDFRIVLYDDRPALNTLSKNDSADEINLIEDYSGIGSILDSGSNCYVVVMTIGYKYDKVVVRALLNKEFKYFGVLGSRAKMAVLLRELKEEGLDETLLDAIRTPIGLDINSRTPNEIAVSIAAEIIAVKNKDNL